MDLSTLLSDPAGAGAAVWNDRSQEGGQHTRRQERGDELADTIRQTFEPDIWRFNGGHCCAIRYRNGRLIVSDPLADSRRSRQLSIERGKVVIS